jgi:hypothetical protein
MDALPVTFISTKAFQKDQNIVVQWNVENESGIQQYEIQKSADGINFSETGIVPALNKSAANYEWTDEQAFEGNNYYRVRSVSRDGKINYTAIVKVLMGKITGNISVYPNPVADGFIHLQMSNQPAGVYKIKLTNSIGQVIIISKIIHENNSTETIPVPRLPKGVYHLEVIKPDGNVKLLSVFN